MSAKYSITNDQVHYTQQHISVMSHTALAVQQFQMFIWLTVTVFQLHLCCLP